MVAKAGLGIIGLGAIGVGGVALAKPAWFGISNEMPTFKTLASKTNELDGKWVKDYKIYFVDSTGNDSWFDWVFKNRYKGDDQNKKTKFIDVKSGKGTEGSLAKACKEAYEADSNKIKTTNSEATGDKFLEENIWKYCSVGGAKPKTVSEGRDQGSYQSHLGATHKTDLLSVEEDSNDWAWHLKQKKFLSDAVPTEEGVFKKFHQENQQHKNEEKSLRLRDECKKRYNEDTKTGSEASTSTTLTADALKKYCSLKVDGPGA